MKKLMLVALMASSLCAFGQGAPAAAKPEAGCQAMKAERQKMTPEQRKEFHEKMLAARKARMAENQNKVIAVLKEAGLTDEQAKTSAEKIEQIYMAGRGPRPGQGPRQGRGRRGKLPEAAK